MALCGKVETARADAVTDFKALQLFIDAYAVDYGDRFEDCLQQVKSVFPNLDLSKVTIDDPLLTTPAGGGTISEETDDFTQSERDPKDDGVILAQLVVERPVNPLIPSTEDPLPQDAKNPSTQDTQNPPSKDDENPPVQDVQNPQFSFFVLNNNFLCILSYFQTILSSLCFWTLVVSIFLYYGICLTFYIRRFKY